MNVKEFEKIIEGYSSLKVLVIGETITDRFISVTYEGHSMKSFCPVFKMDNQQIQDQEGGAMAIANHLKDFVKQVDLITNKPNEIIKTRLIDVNGGSKHAEINEFNVNPVVGLKHNPSNYDVVIVADFGHGFCDKIDFPENAHLMCQTNSNNFGFNRLSKWKNYKKKSVCIDLREASLQLNERINTWNEHKVKELYSYEVNSSDLFVTLGNQGASHYNGSEFTTLPVYKSNVVDTIGAGDTFFAFSSINSALDLDSRLILEIPSIAASLSTTWLCNERSVNKKTLKEHALKFIQ